MSTDPQYWNRWIRRKLGIGTVILLFIAGAAGLWIGYERWFHGSGSIDWESVEGEIVSSEVHQYTSYRARGSIRETSYEPRISYQFKVNGESFTGDRIWFDDVPGGTEEAGRDKSEEYVERFPAGSSTTIYYDPARPERSTLIQGISAKGIWLPGGFGILGWLFALFMLWLLKKQRWKQEREAEELQSAS